MIAASNDGHVGTADAADLRQKNVVIQANEDLQQAFMKRGSIKDLFSRLRPMSSADARVIPQAIMQNNAAALKDIAALYKSVQQDYPTMIVDILPMPLTGELGGAKLSLPYANHIACELHRNGVRNVRLDHIPVPGIPGAY